MNVMTGGGAGVLLGGCLQPDGKNKHSSSKQGTRNVRAKVAT
jgi:hypothetical protein